MMKQLWKFISHFFPVQLLLLHLSRSWLLLFFWVVLFGMVGGHLFTAIGIPYLFLTPEYLGDVNFLSFFILGSVLGFFVMAFHITSYIFYSYRYTFLAALTKPLYRFSINNSLIPLLFYIYYGFHIAYTLSLEGHTAMQIFLQESGLIMGSILSISLSFTYFFSVTKKPKLNDLASALPKPIQLFIKKETKIAAQPSDEHVFTFLRNFWSIRRVRPAGHYDEEDRLRILQQHHTNAALYFIGILALITLLSAFGSNRFVLIPAGASITLLLTTFLMIFGALFSWLKQWTISVLIFGGIVLNFLSGTTAFKHLAEVPGLDYEKTPLPYTYEAIAQLTTDSILAEDKLAMINALDGWKARQKEAKPKLIILNSSGGGLRSTLFTLASMQYIDSITGGSFYDRLFLIAGSSGGIIGAAYYRELQEQRNAGKLLGINGKYYFDVLGTDILNAVGYTMAVNDFFIPLQKIKASGFSYRFDRGMAWDKRFNLNTEFILNKPIVHYAEQESKGAVPLLILTPTIINRGQRLLISPMGLSFLSKHEVAFQTRRTDVYDGVEFRRFFADRQADSLSFVTALRMSSTFPYIAPVVALPTEPPMEVLDAGARDNDGFLLTIRFLHTFKDWIAHNTSGVVIVQTLASRPVDEAIKPNPYTTRVENLVKPFGAMVQNFSTLQGFARAEILNYAGEWVNFPLDVVHIDLLRTSDEVSLSWHLTEREKNFIYQTLRSERLKPRINFVVEQCR